jgi:hypothetical protein
MKGTGAASEASQGRVHVYSFMCEQYVRAASASMGIAVS